jgi:hypothetical protein
VQKLKYHHCPFVKAQSTTTLTPADQFAIPAYNSTIGIDPYLIATTVAIVFLAVAVAFVMLRKRRQSNIQTKAYQSPLCLK